MWVACFFQDSAIWKDVFREQLGPESSLCALYHVCLSFYMLEHLDSSQRKFLTSKQLTMYALECLLAVKRNKLHVTLQVSLEVITLSCSYVRQKYISIHVIN